MGTDMRTRMHERHIKCASVSEGNHRLPPTYRLVAESPDHHPPPYAYLADYASVKSKIYSPLQPPENGRWRGKKGAQPERLGDYKASPWPT